jgi:outer membrane protein
MKKIVLAVAALSIMACNETKIGYVDNSELVNELQEKKDIEAAHKAKAEAYGKKRDSLLQVLQMEDLEFRQRAQKMNPKKAQQEYQLIQQKQQQIASLRADDQTSEHV